jgi:integrase
MPSLKITKREIDRLRKQATDTNGVPLTLWDSDLKGFGCRISTSGKVSWTICKRLGAGGSKAKRVWHAYGDLETMTLDDAKAHALGLLNDTRKGIDLADRKRQQRHAEHTAYASGKLKDVFEAYHKRKSEPGRYWGEINRLFNVEIMPVLGKDTILANITKRDIRSLIENKEDSSPAVARFMFAALRPLFKWAIERELVTVSPMEGLTAPKTNGARDRVLSDSELTLVWKATGEMPYPFGPFYRLLILTAQRRDEVSGMQWSELDLDKGTWIIPKERTKNRREHLVHLAPMAIEVLKGVTKLNSPYVFTKTLTTPISGYSHAKRDLDALINPSILSWRIHDLRRTAASGMAMLGLPPHIVERVLNHISGATGGLVGVYQRHEYVEERKKAVLAWSNYVATIINGVPLTSNVIPIRTA